MRMLNSDGSIDVQDLTYKEIQRVCKMLGLRATGTRSMLVDSLDSYEDEKGIWLKIFIYTIVNRSSEKEFACKVLEIENK